MTLNPKNGMIAVCGIDCSSECDIWKVPADLEAARRVAARFNEKGWGLLVPGTVLCSGCRGNRSVHWYADCWILRCCVDEKRLAFCYEFDSFPCDRLTDWAKQSSRYSRALERVRDRRFSTFLHAGMSISMSKRDLAD